MNTKEEMTEGSYDAYEEDIAVAHFFFEEPTVFEYTRHVIGHLLKSFLIQINYHSVYREARMTTIDYLSQVCSMGKFGY